VGAFQDHVKINFFKGAALDDPTGLFNAGLEAKASRAIKALIRAAVALDEGQTRARPPRKKPTRRR
jgi:hypothetical protein